MAGYAFSGNQGHTELCGDANVTKGPPKRSRGSVVLGRVDACVKLEGWK